MRPIARQGGLFLVLVILVFGPVVVGSQAPAPRAQAGAGQLPDLAAALKATPGCLGVELARTMSGKQVIFAWFENKKAVLNWYYSPAHQDLVRQFAGDERRPGGPLADVPDDGRPVMAVASITLGGTSTASAASGTQPSIADIKSSIRQIAIELYAPLPGGLALGGRFAPSSVKVPGLVDVPAPPK